MGFLRTSACTSVSSVSHHQHLADSDLGRVAVHRRSLPAAEPRVVLHGANPPGHCGRLHHLPPTLHPSVPRLRDRTEDRFPRGRRERSPAELDDRIQHDPVRRRPERDRKGEQ